MERKAKFATMNVLTRSNRAMLLENWFLPVISKLKLIELAND